MDSIYDKLGGEVVLSKLVKDFYNNMDTFEEAQGIRKMHAKNLRISEKKLFMFLSGFFGGPNLYIEEYGHPRLRQRHMPFSIGASEAEQWVFCMKQAIADNVPDDKLANELVQYFIRTAEHMRNNEDTSIPDNLKINVSN